MRLFECAFIISLFTAILASSGDRADGYQRCVSFCDTHYCPETTPFPFALRITRWSCNDDCKYQCMHAITSQAIQDGRTVQQYHGKWPFWRFMGMQEPASVLFSLLNLLAHIHGMKRVKQKVPHGHPMKYHYLTFAFVSMNAWFWSAVFHTRDTPTTEKLDYFCAASSIGYALYYTVVRFFCLYPLRTVSESVLPTPSKMRTIWTIICALTYLGHISYLTLLPRFDYSYNMAFNLAIGVTHNLLWGIYALPSSLSVIQRFPDYPKGYRPRHASRAASLVALSTFATTLELFDFPPWGRIIDAHSLWHFSTVPLIWIWYDVLIEDALDEGWRGQRA